MKGESVEVHASCIMKNLIFYHKVWIFFLLSRENLCHVCFLSKMILLIWWGIGRGGAAGWWQGDRLEGVAGVQEGDVCREFS